MAHPRRRREVLPSRHTHANTPHPPEVRAPRGERGASLIEFTLILPLLVALLFGIVDFGWIYNEQINLRQGVREAARQGAVAETGGDSTCGLVGATGSDNVKELMCLAKDRIGLDDTRVRVKVSFPPAGLYPANTSGIGDPIGNSMLVCAAADIDSLSGVYGALLDGQVSRAKVEFRIEEATGEVELEGQETPLDGDDWSWCVTGATP